MRFPKWLLRIFDTDNEIKKILGNEIKTENNRRVLILTLIAIPVSILHILMFYFKLSGSVGDEYLWRKGIIHSHIIIIAGLSIIGLLVYMSSRSKNKSGNISFIAMQLLMFFLLVGGAAIATIDQLVTNSITPFIVTCIVSAIVILMKPLQSIIYYSISYIVFYNLIELTQKNSDVLASNQVNGITIAGIGLCLSIIFWNNYVFRIKQAKLIEKQKKELEQNYEKLVFYSNELKESNATKDKLFSIIAHDLKSPFNSIIGITELSSEIIDEMDQSEIKEVLSNLNKEARVSYELLNNLLDWSMSQQKKINPNKVKIEAEELIRNIANSIEHISSNKGIKVNIVCENNLIFYADYSMIQTVLKNLLINSLKFTNRGGNIDVKTRKENNMINIAISDNGIGIKEEQMVDLFNITNQKTSFGTENEKGTGLGLQICKEFVELNHGKIWAISEYGKGTEFNILLPLK